MTNLNYPKTKYEVAQLIYRAAEARAKDLVGLTISNGAMPTVDEWRETCLRSAISDLLTVIDDEHKCLDLDYYIGRWQEEIKEVERKKYEQSECFSHQMELPA